MSNNTPLNADEPTMANSPQLDEGLRDILSKVLIDGQNQIHDLKDGKATPEQITERMFASLDYWQPKLQQRITADRERVGLEERLDELNNVRSMWTKPGIGDIKFGHWLHYRQKTLVDLAELKAQQEEV